MINKTGSCLESHPLQALKTAAILLPGLLLTEHVIASDDEVDFQYSHYQEGQRNIAVSNFDSSNIKTVKSFNPIEAESIRSSAKFKINERLDASVSFSQDTWGGATPLATVPYLATGNNAIHDADGTVVGASPLAQPMMLYLDKQLRSLNQTFDPDTGSPSYKLTADSVKLTHIMASASPEVRKQGDFKLGYDLENARVSASGGVSIERDYNSRFASLGSQFEFNQKNTIVNIELNYTNSQTNAILNHDDYTNTVLVNSSRLFDTQGGTGKTIKGNRQDWSPHLSLTQLINKNSIASFNLGYTRTTGYQSNPYKAVAVAFIDPAFQDPIFGGPADGYSAYIVSFTEKRPESRNIFNSGTHYTQYIQAMDAAWHFDYQFSADDWGIQSHTFESHWIQPFQKGWSLIPHIRYYSQDAADFYTPYLVTRQSFYDGFASSKLPAAYSSDQRLSGFGALSGGVTLSKQFSKGIKLDTGFEYYTHQGNLKLGGGGEASYANFDYWVANASLKLSFDDFSSHLFENQHVDHQQHAHLQLPAGVMFGHGLPKAGDAMIGYRYMWNAQSGAMFNGSHSVSDLSLKQHGCAGDNCYLTPNSMSMSMHMFDLMYAPTDWLTLMLMPQFVDMNMNMRSVNGQSAVDFGDDLAVGGHFTHHLQKEHDSGGIGDTGMYAIFKLFNQDQHNLNLSLGLSAPTGDVKVQFTREHTIGPTYMDYSMQLGSGTWDFKPSLTYTGGFGDWFWGGQLSGTVRMQSSNNSGYVLGNVFQTTAWTGYSLTDWLSASARGLYSIVDPNQGAFKGAVAQFKATNATDSSYGSLLKFGPNDYTQNYGGRFWDIGLGLNALIKQGGFGGSQVSLEWLQPVQSDFNGYQLNRTGTLYASWSLPF